MASAAGWFWGMLGKKGKDKGKGFEVVRSSRMPPAMRARGGDFEDETPPEGIPVAMGVLRNGPIDSDDEDQGRRNQGARSMSLASREREPLNSGRISREDSSDEIGAASPPPILTLPTDIGTEKGIKETSQASHAGLDDDLHVPDVPRKSSKRLSWNNSQAGEARLEPSETAQPATLAPRLSRLPFERTSSQTKLSSSSARLTNEFVRVDLEDSNGGSGGGPAGYGIVSKGSVGHVDREMDLLGSSVEVVHDKR